MLKNIYAYMTTLRHNRESRTVCSQIESLISTARVQGGDNNSSGTSGDSFQRVL